MKEPVIFRKFPDGQVVAIFPCLPVPGANPWFMQTYMQRGRYASTTGGIIANTASTEASEYAGILRELEEIGHELEVRDSMPRGAYLARCEVLIRSQGP